jgi:hypothetical protein
MIGIVTVPSDVGVEDIWLTRLAAACIADGYIALEAQHPTVILLVVAERAAHEAACNCRIVTETATEPSGTGQESPVRSAERRAA